MAKVTLIILFFLISTTSSAPTPTEDFPHSLSLSYPDKYHLFWKYDNDTITFEVHVKTLGYIGFGISQTGGMKDSDIVIGWVKNGTAYLQDRYAEREAVPKLDDSQDYILLEGRETDSHTILKFSRKHKTCDNRDVDITADTLRLIWAYNDKEPDTPEQDPPYHGHAFRGTRTMYLIAPPTTTTIELPEDKIYHDFLNANYTIPGDRDTTYYCQAFSVPKLDDKHHMIMVEPIVQPGNEAAVHHILLYGCYHELDTKEHTEYSTWDDLDGKGGICYEENMPTDSCSIAMIAWAIGGGNIYFPDHVGYPLGGSDETMLFLRMETHYDNPQLRNDIVDSSGLRLWLSPTLRENEMGLLTIGMSSDPQHALPPGFPSLKNLAYCPSQCLQEKDNIEDDVKVVATFLHTHLAGRAVRLRSFRNGVEGPIIMRDDHYDFNFQDFRFLPKEINLKPTDEFVMECEYSTTDRNVTTWGGQSTQEEMCFAFVYYYPKMDLKTCGSFPALDQTLSYIPGINKSITLEEYKSKIEKTDWKDGNNRKKFLEAIVTGKNYIYCIYENRDLKYMEKVMPDYVKPLPPLVDTICDINGAGRIKLPWEKVIFITCALFVSLNLLNK